MIFKTNNSELMLEQSMRFLWTKQTAMLDNISNVETPGYKTKYVTFEEAFRARMDAAVSSQKPAAAVREVFDTVKPETHVATDESARADGNGVNLTEQAVELSRNAFQLQYTMQAISGEHAILRSAIRG